MLRDPAGEPLAHAGPQQLERDLLVEPDPAGRDDRRHVVVRLDQVDAAVVVLDDRARLVRDRLATASTVGRPLIRAAARWAASSWATHRSVASRASATWACVGRELGRLAAERLAAQDQPGDRDAEPERDEAERDKLADLERRQPRIRRQAPPRPRRSWHRSGEPPRSTRPPAAGTRPAPAARSRTGRRSPRSRRQGCWRRTGRSGHRPAGPRSGRGSGAPGASPRMASRTTKSKPRGEADLATENGCDRRVEHGRIVPLRGGPGTRA